MAVGEGAKDYRHFRGKRCQGVQAPQGRYRYQGGQALGRKVPGRPGNGGGNGKGSRGDKGKGSGHFTAP